MGLNSYGRNVFIAAALVVFVTAALWLDFHGESLPKQPQQMTPRDVKLWNSHLMSAYPKGSDFRQIETYLKMQGYEEYNCSDAKSSQSERACFRSWIHDQGGAGYNSVEVKYGESDQILELKAELGPHFLVY